MCVYETKKPCDFKELPEQSNFRAAKYSENKIKKCYGGKERAICYCDTDYCNGKFDIFLSKWTSSSVDNLTLFECVKAHIKEKIGQPDPSLTVGISETKF
ncbi:hypothetical protein Y032_1070g3531 [Ancylostoma ceylanicum]|uniref:Uncharacterized protein n=2 Tax=Ancylostoma ceylanicum TaxID=53326 RepID=A0A016W6A6_9BILA|nr:hypothetical protein Y032_1070g3531 [Ancylostoma ceylanicum]